MRLIDADKLMEYCLNQRTKTIDCNDIERFPPVDAVSKAKVMELIWSWVKEFVCWLIDELKEFVCWLIDELEG